MQLRKSNQGSTLIQFRIVYAESFNQKFGIHTIIYCMIFLCRWSDFIMQDRISFESAIPISGCERIVHAEYILSKSLIRGDIFNNIGLL